MFAATPLRRVGLLATVLANAALYGAHLCHLSQPFHVLALSGALYRAGIGLPLSLYGDRCVARAAAALPELHEAHAAYTQITEHPRAIAWEKKVAAQKLTNDRARIFRAHHISNVKLFLPHALAGAAGLYCLGLPSQLVADYLTTEAGMAIVSPLALTVPLGGGVGGELLRLDPTLGLAAGLTCVNALRHLRSREGFNDGMDRILARGRRAVLVGAAAAAVLALWPTLVPAAAAGAATSGAFLPSYLAPVWLGMATTTCVVGEFAHRTAPGRALCRLPPRPPSHGHYGPVSTAEGHDYRLAFTGTDREEKYDMWCSQKRALDYECDIRLQKLLKKVGLFDDAEELDYEADKLRRKREVAAARRLARTNEAALVDAETAEVESIGSYDPAARRAAARQAAWSQHHKTAQQQEAADELARGRHALNLQNSTHRPHQGRSEEGEEGPSAEDMAFHYLDAYQEQQQQRREARQAARAAAMGMASPTEDLDKGYQTFARPQEQPPQPEKGKDTTK